MKTFVAFFALVSVACAAPQVTIAKKGYGPSTFVRAPAHDSASIEHHRLGGNFAYSTAEAHAFAEVTPEISVATHPVAETTYTHVPAPIKTVQPPPVVHTTHAARPVFGQQPVFGQEPVIGPVAEHVTVHQPVFKQQHVTVHQPQQTVVTQPLVHKTVAVDHHVAAAPVAVAAAPAAVAVEGYAAHGYAAAAPAFAHGYAAAPAAYAHGIAAAPIAHAALPAAVAAAPAAVY